MVLLGRLPVERSPRLHRIRRRSGPLGRAVAGVTPGLLHQRHQPVVLNVSGRRHHEVPADVAAVVVRRDRWDGHVRDHLRAADDRPAQRVVAEDGCRQDVVHLVRGLVLVHGDLLDHHLALGVDVRVGGPQHHVRQHVEGLVEMLVQEARVHRGGLLPRSRVRLGAHAVEDLVDLDRAEAIGALEQQVLEEVRDAGLLR